MQGEHASGVQALVHWLERHDELGQVNDKNYEQLAAIGDRWDIPMLQRDIEVCTDRAVLPILLTVCSTFSVLRKNRRLSSGCSPIDMTSRE